MPNAENDKTPQTKYPWVNAGLSAAFFRGDQAQNKVLVDSEQIRISVIEDKIIQSELTDELAENMDSFIQAFLDEDHTMWSWTLYIAYMGRCWYLENSKCHDHYTIGYFVLNDVKDAVSVLANSESEHHDTWRHTDSEQSDLSDMS